MHRSHRLALALPIVVRLACAIAPARAADLVQDGRAAELPAFNFVGDAETRRQAVNCLAAAVYYEAGDQPVEGREAVAQVVLNRLRDPAFPKSVCQVVYQGASRRGCQFTFACDGSPARRPAPPGAWRDAQAVAERALNGHVDSEVGGATHYHALYVHPAWSAGVTPLVQIGMHRFYRLAGGQVAAAAAASVGAGVQAAAAAAGPQPRFSLWGLDPKLALAALGNGEALASVAEASP